MTSGAGFETWMPDQVQHDGTISGRLIKPASSVFAARKESIRYQGAEGKKDGPPFGEPRTCHGFFRIK